MDKMNRNKPGGPGGFTLEFKGIKNEIGELRTVTRNLTLKTIVLTWDKRDSGEIPECASL